LNMNRGISIQAGFFTAAFQKRVNTAVLFRHTYESRITQIFNEELEKYRKVELQYDKETGYFHNREQQQKWNLFFARELEKMR